MLAQKTAFFTLAMVAVVASTASLVGLQRETVGAQGTAAPVTNNVRQFQLRFTHTVENTGATAVHRQDLWVLVPQSGPNQTVLSVTYNPQPLELLTDNWGQPVAHYVIPELPGYSHLDIGWTAEVQLTDVSFPVSPDSVSGLASIPSEVITAYTGDATKYAVTSPTVQQAAREAVGTDPGLYAQVRSIYDYVIGRLSYVRDDAWDDAATVLARGTGSCTEYSFVLVALLRANGIPARWVGGSRLRADDNYNDTIFHRAVEVYLPGYGWLPLDADLGDSSGNPDAYFLKRYNDHFIMATAGDRSSLLSWDYHSRLKVADPAERAQIVSERSVYWKATNLSAPPEVTTGGTAGIGASSAQLTGNLAGKGTAQSVAVSFEYGPTTSYGKSAVASPSTLGTPGSFTALLSGLTPNTVYHYRAKAVGDGTVYGSDKTFRTPKLARSSKRTG